MEKVKADEVEFVELLGQLDSVAIAALTETMKALHNGASEEEAYAAGDVVLEANGRKPYLPVYLSNKTCRKS